MGDLETGGNGRLVNLGNRKINLSSLHEII